MRAYRRKCRRDALGAERASQGIESLAAIQIGQQPRIRTARQQPRIAQHRRHREQPGAQMLALGRSRAATLQQFLGLLEARPRVSAGHPQQILRITPRFGEFARLQFERAPYAPIRRGRNGQRVRARISMAALEHDSDVGHAQAAKTQLRASRTHRRQQRIGSRRDEDEHRSGKRLFEGLEQRVLRRSHQRISILDDGDTPATFERPIHRPIDGGPHLLDLDGPRLSRRDALDVGMRPALDTAAGRALATGVTRPLVESRAKALRHRGDVLRRQRRPPPRIWTRS